MTPVLSIIGKSNSGKTTLIEKTIPELIKKGRRIAAVKHDRSHGFDFDKKGKDSWRHKDAGAVATILSSPKTLAMVRDLEEELTLIEIAELYADDVDLLIAEGYKDGDHPKVEIAVNLPENELACKKDKNIVALISNDNYDLNMPQFKRDSIKEIAEWIEHDYIKNKNR